MPIGANDRIDQLLVKKYANIQTNKTDLPSTIMPADKVMEIMNDYANLKRIALSIDKKLVNGRLPQAGRALPHTA